VAGFSQPGPSMANGCSWLWPANGYCAMSVANIMAAFPAKAGGGSYERRHPAAGGVGAGMRKAAQRHAWNGGLDLAGDGRQRRNRAAPRGEENGGVTASSAAAVRAAQRGGVRRQLGGVVAQWRQYSWRLFSGIHSVFSYSAQSIIDGVTMRYQAARWKAGNLGGDVEGIKSIDEAVSVKWRTISTVLRRDSVLTWLWRMQYYRLAAWPVASRQRILMAWRLAVGGSKMPYPVMYPESVAWLAAAKWLCCLFGLKRQPVGNVWSESRWLSRGGSLGIDIDAASI